MHFVCHILSGTLLQILQTQRPGFGKIGSIWVCVMSLSIMLLLVDVHVSAFSLLDLKILSCNGDVREPEDEAETKRRLPREWQSCKHRPCLSHDVTWGTHSEPFHQCNLHSVPDWSCQRFGSWVWGVCLCYGFHPEFFVSIVKWSHNWRGDRFGHIFLESWYIMVLSDLRQALFDCFVSFFLFLAFCCLSHSGFFNKQLKTRFLSGASGWIRLKRLHLNMLPIRKVEWTKVHLFFPATEQKKKNTPPPTAPIIDGSCLINWNTVWAVRKCTMWRLYCNSGSLSEETISLHFPYFVSEHVSAVCPIRTMVTMLTNILYHFNTFVSLHSYIQCSIYMGTLWHTEKQTSRQSCSCRSLKW